MNIFSLFSEPSVPSVTCEDLKKAIDTHEACMILDVRTIEEVHRGKIVGSIHISIHDLQQRAQDVLTDKTKKIYVYCLTGSRSSHAVKQLMDLGYTNVFNVKQGILAWRAHYFPVEV